MPKVSFYIPSPELVNDVPTTIHKYWRWINECTLKAPAKLPDGDGFCTWLGPYNWTVQTFIYLRAYGFPCSLTASLPDEGIVVTHSDFLPALLKASAKRFIVEIKPDRFLRCRFANFVIVQNRRDPIHNGLSRLLIKSAFVNYWPQPSLTPRDPDRGDRFENICFMGNREQFLREGDALALEYRKLGLNWTMTPRERWHDYSKVDAIIAVRPFGSATLNGKDVAAFFSSDRKPASKLINAWLAGVPAILSPDAAFQEIRRSELDYLEARNIPEIIERIRQLMHDPSLRRSMMENGKKRAEKFIPEKTVQTWIKIFEGEIIPEYMLWAKSPFCRAWLVFSRTLTWQH
jgi:hypothetical protein